MSEPMTERRAVNHYIMNKLYAIYSDLSLAESTVIAMDDNPQKHKALCCIRNGMSIARVLTDNKLGPEIIRGDKEGTHYTKEA